MKTYTKIPLSLDHRIRRAGDNMAGLAFAAGFCVGMIVASCVWLFATWN